jgi:hypothetical protein
MKTLALAALMTLAAMSGVQAIEPRVFATPIEAADALTKATEGGETAPLLDIFGDKHQGVIGTSDPARDKELRGRFAKMAKERRRFRVNDDGSVTVVVGFGARAFPIPLVKREKGWTFDTDAGIDEVVKRRIGENELDAIAALRAYVDAQRQYAAEPRDGTAVRQFARKLLSAPGKKDGLHWPTEAGEAPSPSGGAIADGPAQYAGYHFRILTAQGPAAPAGQYDYVINDHLIGGFALVAWPAVYGETGVMTLLVNHYGIVYERDLGPDTKALAEAMKAYNPDDQWKPSP